MKRVDLVRHMIPEPGKEKKLDQGEQSDAADSR